MKSNKGFSLIELMLVLVIVGVLAVLGASQLDKLQESSGRAEGKTELIQVYTSQKTFFAEWDTYHPNLVLIGYRPEGTHTYSVGFSDGQVILLGGDSSADSDIRAEYADGLDLGGSFDINAYNTTEEICSSTELDDWCTFDTRFPSPGTLTRSSIPNYNLFTAQAKGRLNLESTEWDDWTINQNRDLVLHTNGQ